MLLFDDNITDDIDVVKGWVKSWLEICVAWSRISVLSDLFALVFWVDFNSPVSTIGFTIVDTGLAAFMLYSVNAVCFWGALFDDMPDSVVEVCVW